MKNVTVHTGTLRILERLPNSRNGNPRYFCQIQDKNGTGPTFRTAPDSSYSYSLPNYRDKEITVSLGAYYGRCTLAGIH